jgi:hypothetical protein
VGARALPLLGKKRPRLVSALHATRLLHSRRLSVSRMRENFTYGCASSKGWARFAGVSPAEARARRLVAWMAGRRETNDLKPIDNAIVRMVASHRAAAQANAQVAPKMSGPGGRARNREGEGSIEARRLADTILDSGGVVAAAR